MKRKILPMLGLMAAMTLVACGGKTSTEAPKSNTGKSVATSKATSKSSKAPESKEPAPVAEWVADGAKNGLVNPEKWGTDATKKAYRLDVADAAGWNKADTKMNEKDQTAANSKSTWTITQGAIPNGTYEIDMSVKMTNASHTDRYWYNMAIKGNETKTSSQDKADEDPFRYFFKLNGGEAVNPTVEDNWGAQGLSADDYKAVTVVGTVTVTDLTSFQLCHGNIGYSLIIEYVRLIAK